MSSGFLDVDLKTGLEVLDMRIVDFRSWQAGWFAVAHDVVVHKVLLKQQEVFDLTPSQGRDEATRCLVLIRRGDSRKVDGWRLARRGSSPGMSTLTIIYLCSDFSFAQLTGDTCQ